MKKNSTKKNEKAVALHSYGASAVPIRFTSSSDLLSQHDIVTTDAPSNNETFENVSSFKPLTSEKENTKSIRNFVVLPPFTVFTMLSAASHEPADTSQCVTAMSLIIK